MPVSSVDASAQKASARACASTYGFRLDITGWAYLATLYGAGLPPSADELSPLNKMLLLSQVQEGDVNIKTAMELYQLKHFELVCCQTPMSAGPTSVEKQEWQACLHYRHPR